jgi:DNA modification methylase
MNALNKPDNNANRSPRSIEVGFPIVEINRLAEPERNNFKPIYQMHKWFARRASCVFRAILLAALKPAVQPDGRPTDLMSEFYKNHTDDLDLKGKTILDPFMGGGTTIVEALRLGCTAIGMDLNPVAWFIVKTEIASVKLSELKSAFVRLCERGTPWNGDRPLRESLLDLYKTEVAPGVSADAMYTLWVQHAICTDQSCKKEVPLFKDYFIAHRTVGVRYWRDLKCPACGDHFDWETEPATLILDKRLMINASRGSAGEGRPTAVWTYAPEPEKPTSRKQASNAELDCPCCSKRVRIAVPWDRKKERKKVLLSVLLCPACENVWQWRGPLPEGQVRCASCAKEFDPRKGNVSKKGEFQCACGNKDEIIESVRLLPKGKRLPVRPYAMQAYLTTASDEDEEDIEGEKIEPSLFSGSGCPTETPLERNELPEYLLLAKNGKFFKRFSPSDKTALIQIDQLWQANKDKLPYPTSKIPFGAETARLLEHHFEHWHEMFASRQLLALGTLLSAIIDEPDRNLRELLLCAFSMTLNNANLFCRYHRFSYREGKIEGLFSRHDFQIKTMPCEGNCFGIVHGYGSFIQNFAKLLEGKADAVDGTAATIAAVDAAQKNFGVVDCVITDPPYVGNVNYAELADFFYVWLRLVLKSQYPSFAPEYTPKAEEIIENQARGKSQQNFYLGLSRVFAQIHNQLAPAGCLAFTFHHTDQEGTVWEGLLQTLCETGFEIIAVYPIHGEAESSLNVQGKENITYDLIHVCRRRIEDPTARSWAGIRQEVRRRARAELAAIEKGRYGNRPLAEPDVRLVCIGKCLELYSAHYGRVLDYRGNPLPLHRALQDISAIVDQLVTRERPLPSELENIDNLSYVWLRCLMPRRAEVSVDTLSKELRALQVSVDYIKDAGLIVRGRTGRGRTYEVKQPEQRLESALEVLAKAGTRQAQTDLFNGSATVGGLVMVELWHALIALASAGESVIDLLERFKSKWPEIAAGLRYCQDSKE